MSLRDFLRAKADELAAGCKKALSIEVVEVHDRGHVMWDDDGSGTYLMCVGSFHDFDIMRVETRHVFGIRWLRYRRRKRIVSFGGHDFFGDSPLREPWCLIYDVRVADTAKHILKPLGDFWNPVTFTVMPGSSPS